MKMKMRRVETNSTGNGIGIGIGTSSDNPNQQHNHKHQCWNDRKDRNDRNDRKRMRGNQQAKATVTEKDGQCDIVSERYEKIGGRVGEGTYGVVYKARDRQWKKVKNTLTTTDTLPQTKTSDHDRDSSDNSDDRIVALKRCLPHHQATDGFALTTLRELTFLRIGQRHSNIVRLLNVCVSKTASSSASENGDVFLVFEYCPHDIAQILDWHMSKHHQRRKSKSLTMASSPSSPFSQRQVQRLMYQLSDALAFLHTRRIVHRDVKPSNLLYDEQQNLKLADFGLCRSLPPIQSSSSSYSQSSLSSPTMLMTPNVVSLWYRSPELLGGISEFATATATASVSSSSPSSSSNRDYSTAIDQWACGCVMAELLTGQPLLTAKSEMEQLENIDILLGRDRQGFGQQIQEHNSTVSLQLWDQFDSSTTLSQSGLELLTSLLEYHPDHRGTAKDMLTSDWFQEGLNNAKRKHFSDTISDIHVNNDNGDEDDDAGSTGSIGTSMAAIKDWISTIRMPVFPSNLQ